MRTIEEIRLTNFKRLVDEIRAYQGLPEGEDPSAPSVATYLGISKVYAWQLLSGARSNIDSKGARKIEEHAEKPTGWLDTDFDLWPFPGLGPDSFERLNRDQIIEIQGIVRREIERFMRPNTNHGESVSKNGTGKFQETGFRENHPLATLKRKRGVTEVPEPPIDDDDDEHDRPARRNQA